MSIRKIMYAIFLVMVLGIADAQGECTQKCQKEDWKQRMLSEKIAFLSGEMDLSPQEAQVFWPVYNQVWKERDEAMKDVFRAFRELQKALDEERSEKEISKLLDAYLSAQDRQRDVEGKSSEMMNGVLPAEKLARYYVAEEKFRRMQIHKLHAPSQGAKGQPR